MPVRTLRPDSKVTIGKHLLSKQIDDDIVILDLDKNIYYGLTGVGTKIWEIGSDGASVSEMHQYIAREYDVMIETAEADLKHFLTELAAKGLIDIHE